MVSLLDVNVLVALLVPEHEHHTTAVNWFAAARHEFGWATCAVTELGLIRVCAQLPGRGWPPDRTADHLLILTATASGHVFWPDASSPAVMAEVRTAETARQITDRYLLGLARRYGGRLVTFDRALASSAGQDAFGLPAPSQ